MKKKTFRDDAGYYRVIDKISSFSDTTVNRRKVVKIIMEDGSWSYVPKGDWDKHLAEYFETIFKVNIGQYHERFAFRHIDKK